MLTWCSVAVVVIVVAVSAGDELPWWKTAVLYQVYPKSFKDSNGDGIGDLKGISQKADHFKDIGVTAIWINPIYPSPHVDSGYDISDFRDIDPLFGTLDDFKELVQKLRELNIKLVLDLVPNHSSDKHDWFQKSLQRIDPYTDYYIWNDGILVDNDTQKRAPPNNWASTFGGSCWEWREERKQFYFHQFLKQQPDFDLRNPAVIQEIKDLMKFWMDLGVDGFRVDAVPFLVEDKQLRNEPWLPGHEGGDTFYDFIHQYTIDLPEDYEIVKELGEFVYNYSLVDGKQKIMFLEGRYGDLNTTMKCYYGGHLDFMMPFNFFMMTSTSAIPYTHADAVILHDSITAWMNSMPEGGVPNWVTGNHDEMRAASRYGPEMADAMNLLTGVLPGVKVVYYGEEIGMQDTFLSFNKTEDPFGKQHGSLKYQLFSRDPPRTPMQWEDAVSAGFSKNRSTWMPVNPNY